jgi:hypothetical protein
MIADFFAPFGHGALGRGAAHVIYCRGCQHAWYDTGAIALAEVGLDDLTDACSCTCTDGTAPGYEDWVVDPEFELPEGAWAT